jgi:hypothetical protein
MHCCLSHGPLTARGPGLHIRLGTQQGENLRGREAQAILQLLQCGLHHGTPFEKEFFQ